MLVPLPNGRRCGVPLYYFDVIDGSLLHRDNFGTDLADFEEAQAQCILPDVARDELPFGEYISFVCEVRDETGRVVYRGELTYRGQRDPV